jgi:hypothetical protein
MKVVRKSNFRVEVYPIDLGDFGAIKFSENALNMTEEQIEKAYRTRCQEMALKIENSLYVSHTKIVCDTEETCGDCGEDYSEYPYCCQDHKVIFEYEKQHGI